MHSVIHHTSRRHTLHPARRAPDVVKAFPRAPTVLPRWRVYREALVASFSRGRWHTQPLDQTGFSITLIEVEETPLP